MQVQVQLGHNGQRARVRLIDLSCHGARLRLVHALRRSDVFWVTLPGHPPISARVSWVNGFMIGCEFTTPLHQTIFDSIINVQTDRKSIDRRRPKIAI